MEDRINKMLAWEESQQKANKEAQQYIGKLEDKLNLLRENEKRLQTDNDCLQHTLDEIYTSLSWRIMHPFHKRD